MTMLAPKRPVEVRRYVLDYARELGGDPIAEFQLVVASGAITIQSQDQDGPYRIVALIGAGLDGQTSTLELQMTTESGQLLIRDMSLTTANVANTSGGLPSSTTKGQIVNMAFGEIGLPGYEFDATPTEQADALQRLDVLMALMASPGENLDLGYNSPASVGASAMTDISGVPDLALDYVVGRLALSVAPGIGKTLSIEARRRMAESYRAVRATFSRIPHVHLPHSTARGAGAKPWSTWRPYMGGLSSGQQNGPSPIPQPPGALATETGVVLTTENGEIIGA